MVNADILISLLVRISQVLAPLCDQFAQ